MQNGFILFLPTAVFFGSLFWLMVFLASYLHFPKMETSKRVKMSIVNATLMTILVLAVAAFGLLFLFNADIQG